MSTFKPQKLTEKVVHEQVVERKTARLVHFVRFLQSLPRAHATDDSTVDVNMTDEQLVACARKFNELEENDFREPSPRDDDEYDPSEDDE